MGLFDLFKRKEEEIIIREIALEDAIKESIQKNLEDKKFLLEIQEKLSLKIEKFLEKLKDNTSYLSTIDLTDKKEDMRLKRLTLQGLEEYTLLLHRLRDSLKTISKDLEILEYIQTIDQILNNFIRNSSKKYHRATILIGNELAEIHEGVTGFYKETTNIVREHHEPILRLEKQKELEENKRNFEEKEKELQRSLKAYKLVEREQSQKEKELEKSKLRLEEARKREDYLGIISKKEEARKELIIIEKKILDLRDLLNLRDISKRVHGSAKDHKIISAYRDNFSSALQEDTSFKLFDILNLQEQELVKEGLEKLQKKKMETQQVYDSSKPENLLIPIQTLINELERNIQSLEEKKNFEEKKLNKFKEVHTELEERRKDLVEGILDNVRIV